MKNKAKALNGIFSVVLSILSLLYIFPVVMILFNSFKQENSITTDGAFTLPTAETFDGLTNYVNAIGAQGFLSSLGYSLFITISSVAAILLFCSMSAWYLARVKSWFSTMFYYLCVFSMVVPFQMVMYTLSATADKLKLNTPWNIWIIYLGFGAGLAVFMITGFILLLGTTVAEGTKRHLNVSPLTALIIGIAQFFAACFPGISRSGTTVSAAMCCRVSKNNAIRYSFILSVPAVLASGLVEFKDAMESTEIIPVFPLLVGVVASAVVGVLSIKLLQLILKKNLYKYFGIYCVILGFIVTIIGAVEVFIK